MDTERKNAVKLLNSYEPIAPICERNNIPIVMASSNSYVGYTTVALFSLLSNASCNFFYDILLLSAENYSKENYHLLNEITRKFQNCSIRLINLSNRIPNKMYIDGHISIETYARLLVPQMLKNYNDVVYLDGDLIINCDVSQLFDTPYPVDAMVSGVPDLDVIGQYYGPEFSMRYYLDRILKLDNPTNYLQAGVLLFHLKNIRRSHNSNVFMEVAAKSKLRYFDQDVINAICNKTVHILDYKWNVVNDYNGIRVKNIISNAPTAMLDQYLKSRKSPGIIHYSGSQKPWNSEQLDMGEYYKKTLSSMRESLLHVPYYKVTNKKQSKLNHILPCQSFQRELVKTIYFAAKYELNYQDRSNMNDY